MKLSNELSLAHAWWHEVRTGGHQFTAEGAEMFERLLACAVGLARDLEERLQAAVEAREALARVETLMRGTPDDRVSHANVVPFRRPGRELTYEPIDGGAA